MKPGTNAFNFAKSMNEQNIAQLKKYNLRAYLVHFGRSVGPKVFITRSKQRLISPGGPVDPYNRPRQCGGRHTKTGQANNVSGNNCNTMCLRDLFKEEEFVAAGTLKRDEQVLRGKDGRRYKGRNDVIKFDIDLTQAIQSTTDPLRHIADSLKREATVDQPQQVVGGRYTPEGTPRPRTPIGRNALGDLQVERLEADD